MSASRTADLDGLIRSLSLRVTHHSPASPPRRNSVRWIRRSKGMSLAELVDHVIGVDPTGTALPPQSSVQEPRARSPRSRSPLPPAATATATAKRSRSVPSRPKSASMWRRRGSGANDTGRQGSSPGSGSLWMEENRRLRRARRSRVRERDRRRSPQGRTHPPIPRMTVHDRHRDRDRGLDHLVEHLTTPLSPRLPLAPAGGSNAHECSEGWLQKTAATPR